MEMLSLKFAPTSLPRVPSRSRFRLPRTKDSLVYSRDDGNAFQTNNTALKWAERSALIRSIVPAKDFVPRGGRNLSVVEKEKGIGITGFLSGKKFFITGATGFLAKVLVEKIIRAVPDFGKIYVLINATTEEAARERLMNEIINCELFQCIRRIHGKSYEAFMLSKLVPVAGKISSPSLGIREDLHDSIIKEVDIIVNSAANTTFDGRYDTALATNTQGPCHLLNFGRRCRELKVFLHVSTAYANGKRKGNIKEMPFRIDDNTVVQENLDGSDIPILDVEREICLASDSRKVLGDHLVKREMEKLGSERAKTYGWQNTYVFTKAMGEMMIDKTRGNIPVVIIRPSIIESTLEDPFPGWIQGNRMVDPIILSYGKGFLTRFLNGEKTVIDLVPADMVVNATLAAIAKHGMGGESGINVYQVASSVVNPLLMAELHRLLYIHFSASPFTDSQGRPILVSPTKLSNSMDEFLDFLSRESSNEGISEKKSKYLARVYEPYLFYNGRFDNSNTERLMESMSEDEKRTFGFDVRSIDWEDYITKVHTPGLRRFVVKEEKLTQLKVTN